MSLFIGDQLVQGPDGLSELGRQAIAFVDGGSEWLRWAISAAAVRYAFPDESALAGALQQGLHSSPFALLPTLELMVSPVKLMTLGLADLRVLARVEAGDKTPKALGRAQRLIEDHELLTASDLKEGTAYLGQLGVSGAPVFQVMGFDAARAIYELTRLGDEAKETPTDLDREAAVFAVKEARTAVEFADYFRIYLEMAAKPGVKAATSAARAALAERAVHALLPLMFWALDCPQVTGLVPPSEVAEAIEGWLASGKSVGFARLSAGVREIVSHTKYRGEQGPEAREYLSGYLAASRALLNRVVAERGVMGQDGASSTFTLEAGDCEGGVQLDAGGVISLAWFRRKARPKGPIQPADEQLAPETEDAL